MKITIRVEAAVPYTTLVVGAEVSADESQMDCFNVAVDLLKQEVIRRIDTELEARGIKLGPDGLRIE